MSRLLNAALAIALIACLAGTAVAGEYAYPYTDPYVATVVGTPPDMMYTPKRTARPVGHTLRVDDRVAPELFWHSEEMRYSVVMQDGDAPLMFLVAGTGAGHNSQKNAFLQQVFFDAGYHVVCLPSPTHPNFIVSASTSRAPGYIRDDVKDLYRVMQLVIRDLDIADQVTDYSVGGYSLGGAQSAFLSWLDEERGAFNFRRVLMINPPVSLYNSALRLDALHVDGPGAQDNIERTTSRLLKTVSEFYTSQDKVDFGGDLLYRLYNFRKVPGDDLRTLIAVSFRMSSASIIFATDLTLGAGYVVPQGQRPVPGDPLLGYLLTTVRLSFEDYFEEFLAPYLIYRNPALTRESIIRDSSLRSIRDYLRGSEKIVMVTNADDPILDGAEVDFLRRTFGARGIIYPVGGHCGNIMYRDNVQDMLRLMQAGEGR
ncbi:alpha/beta hydrolase [Desulfobaculum sp.]